MSESVNGARGVGEFGMTVVIPNYEAWPMLRRTLCCLEADAARLDRPCQIVVVDNGSTAETRRRMEEFALGCERLELVLRDDIGGVHFRPGSARNMGVRLARFEQVVFFDADCIPAPETLGLYAAAFDSDPGTVFIGHRAFIDATGLSGEQLAHDREGLARLPTIRSASNYRHLDDRRMDELRHLDRHPRPYDCLHGCNFGVSKAHFRDGVEFDHRYDGAWGYEDIDLGYQLHLRGSRFHYLPDAFVYHQEAAVPRDAIQRNDDRLRNIRILDRKVGDFIAYRQTSSRVCPLPTGVDGERPSPEVPDRDELRPGFELGLVFSRGFAG